MKYERSASFSFHVVDVGENLFNIVDGGGNLFNRISIKHSSNHTKDVYEQ